MNSRNYYLAGMTFVSGLILLFTSSFFINTPPEPVAWWNLDHFETDHAIDKVTGIPDMISGRFHYSHDTGGGIIRYPTHLKRVSKSAPLKIAVSLLRQPSGIRIPGLSENLNSINSE